MISLRSFWIAAVATALCLVLGFPLALFIARSGSRKNLYLSLVILPFWTSFLIRTYAWMFLLRDTGLINTVLQALGLIRQPLPLLYNDGAVILGLVYGFLPFMVLPLYATLERLDPSLLEAAADLGAQALGDADARHASAMRAGNSRRRDPGIRSVSGHLPHVGPAGRQQDRADRQRGQNQFTTARDWPFGAAVSLALMAIAMLLLFAMRAGEAKSCYETRRWLGLRRRAPTPFLHVPLLILAVFSFNSSRFTVWQGFSLHWYRAALARSRI